MRGCSSIQSTIPATHHQPTEQEVAVSIALGGFLIFLPIIVVCAIAGYRKHRAMVLQSQIQRLNRLWQLDSSQNLF
jgi:hypothetical protein